MRQILIAVAVVGLAVSARADDWSKTFQLNGNPVLSIHTSDANIHVDTWSEDRIEARVSTEGVKIGDGGLKIEANQTGNAVNIEVRFPHDHVGLNFGMKIKHVNVDIHMPREGQISLHTSDGSIQLSHFKGDMSVESGDGHQEIDGVEGNLRAHTGDGYIHADGRFDGLDASTGDGKIEARALAGSRMNSSWRLHTGDGSVEMELPQDFAADVEMRTGDGHIDLGLPVTVEGGLSRNEVRGKLNGGGNLLSIQTGDGSIKLGKLSGAL
jgi:hypothetical protein